MEYLIVIIGIAALAGLTYWLKTKKWTGQRIRDALVNRGIDPKKYAKFKATIKTPAGITIWSTVENVPQAFLETVDASARRVIRNHTRRYPHWKNHLDLSQWSMCLIDPMTTNQETVPGSPALIVNGYQTAGTVIGTGAHAALKPPMFVIPHQADRGWVFLDYFAASVYNEGEHLFERVNDYGTFLYYATAGDVHPHVPDEEPGFAEAVQAPCAGGVE